MRVLMIVYISAIDGNLSRVYQVSRPVTAGFRPAASLNWMMILLPLFRPHYSGSFLILFILVNRSENLELDK